MMLAAWTAFMLSTACVAHLLTNVSFSSDAHSFGFYLNESTDGCLVTPLDIELFPGTSFYASIYVRSCLTQCQFDSPVLIESLLCKSNTELCDAGKLNDFNSSSRCDRDCPAGYFCPAPFAYNGSEVALLEPNRYSRVYQCAAGTCCDEATIEPMACQRTQYCPQAFNQNCTETNLACPLGYYCPDGKVKLPCPAGYFCNATSIGNYTEHLCPAGKYCPSPGTIVPVSCPINQACDVGSVLPQTCKEGEYLMQVNNNTGYFTCADCYPGRYCEGSNYPPQVCDAAGYCPTLRSCRTGLDCIRINGASPPCNVAEHTICDVAFYVRPGKRDILRERNQTLLVNDASSYLFDVDTENAQHIQVVMQNSSSHQVWINCVDASPALCDFKFVGEGDLALMVTNCALDSTSLQFSNMTRSILIVLSSGVMASANAFSSLNENQLTKTTILMRDGARIDPLATWPFIRDLIVAMPSAVPTRAPTARGSNTQEPSSQNFSTTVAVAITMSILSLALLAFAQHRFKLWYRSKGLTVAVIPSANTLIGEIQLTEIQRQQQQREDSAQMQERQQPQA